MQWAKGNPRDSAILLAGALLLSLVSAIACATTAWRAAKVDPMTALRCDSEQLAIL
jgi:ABC-type lipoprotein release transport system permease subunit